MIEFNIGSYVYDVSAGIGWGRISEQENTTYDAATAVVYSAVTPSGFGHDIAIPTTGLAWGGISNTLSNYGLEQHLGSGSLGDIIAYDDTRYGILVALFIAEGASVFTTWVASSVTPSGFGHDIAIGGPTWGAYQETEFIAYKSLVFSRTVRVAGEINTIFTVPPPLGVRVSGSINVTFGNLAGSVTIEGACHVVGEIAASFTTPKTNSCAVVGEIDVNFLTQSGQSVGCITPDDSVPDAEGGEENYVF